MHSLNHIVKFADDMTVVGLISKNDESAYRERPQSDHSPLFIDGSPVEIINSTKFLGVHLVENFTWSLNTSLAAPLLPAEAEESPSTSPHPDHVLQRDHQEHPEQLHHCLVGELHCLGSQDPAEDTAQNGWNDVALQAIFREGLNFALRTEMAYSDQDIPLSQYITLMIKMDNLMRKQDSLRRFRSLPITTEHLPATSSCTPEPMQLGKTKVSWRNVNDVYSTSSASTAARLVTATLLAQKNPVFALLSGLQEGPSPPPPVILCDSPVTSVESFHFLGTTITKELKWEHNIRSLTKKAQQRMYFLWQLKKFLLPVKMLVNIYTAIIESILTSSITVWFAAATARDKAKLQGVIYSAEKVIGCSLPSPRAVRLQVPETCSQDRSRPLSSRK
ncbi:hypothetical protein QTP70_001902 [Hemibagrus guttatus]|uniref:Alkylated DNA repair protein AlkB homologue 8 N-terminal domain-containing protein n=1 Tax=Hemibagrus guttatus TaxID=175788 RepID=A0AAE0UWF7_9TELE|nr:hypothetical protein QTP70_001902 [Hemibagrus guttatus]